MNLSTSVTGGVGASELLVIIVMQNLVAAKSVRYGTGWALVISFNCAAKNPNSLPCILELSFWRRLPETNVGDIVQNRAPGVVDAVSKKKIIGTVTGQRLVKRPIG
jgi:hypothetical protein